MQTRVNVAVPLVGTANRRRYAEVYLAEDTAWPSHVATFAETRMLSASETLEMADETDRSVFHRGELRRSPSPGSLVRWLAVVWHAGWLKVAGVLAAGQGNVLRQYHRLDTTGGREAERADDWSDLT